MISVGWKMPEDILNEASAKYMHKIIYNKTPEDIYRMIKFPRSRTCAETTLQYGPKSDRLKRCSIFAGIKNYNRLPGGLKALDPRKLKAKLKLKKLN